MEANHGEGGPQTSVDSVGGPARPVRAEQGQWSLRLLTSQPMEAVGLGMGRTYSSVNLMVSDMSSANL